MDLKRLDAKNIIEAALFIMDRPVSFQELAELVQQSEDDIEKYIELLRDEYMDRKSAYTIADTEKKEIVQLKLRDDVAAHLHWPFIQRSEVPQHLLKILSFIAFKEYVLNEELTPTKLYRLFGKKRTTEDLDQLISLSLVNVTPKGKKTIITVSEDFLNLFKLPLDPPQTKLAIQTGLRNYALKQLQYD